MKVSNLNSVTLAGKKGLNKQSIAGVSKNKSNLVNALKNLGVEKMLKAGQGNSGIRMRLADAMEKGGSKIKPEELLFYQIKVGEFHLKVEVASRASESFSGTIKKLQNG